MGPVVITVLIKAVSMIFSTYESNVLIVFNQLCSVVLYGLAGESFSLALTQQTNTNSNMYTPCLFRLQDELEPWCVARLLCQTQMNVTGLLYCVFLNNHFYITKTPKRPGPSLSANSKTEEGREDRQIGPSVQEDIAQAATLLAKTWTKSKPTKLERSCSSEKKKKKKSGVLISFTILRA